MGYRRTSSSSIPTSTTAATSPPYRTSDRQGMLNLVQNEIARSTSRRTVGIESAENIAWDCARRILARTERSPPRRADVDVRPRGHADRRDRGAVRRRVDLPLGRDAGMRHRRIKRTVKRHLDPEQSGVAHVCPAVKLGTRNLTWGVNEHNGLGLTL